MQYKIIAIDLDGTLLHDDGFVSQQNRDAIKKAQDAGALVVPCTGRGWRESIHAVEQMFDVAINRETDSNDLNNLNKKNLSGGDPDLHACSANEIPHVTTYDADVHQPGVFVTGAAVNDVHTGNALDLAIIDPALTKRIVDQLHDLPEAVLVFRDVDKVGHDYLITGKGELTANTSWWFDQWRARTHHQPDVEHDDLHFALRVGMVASELRVPDAVARLENGFDDELFFHHFAAVQTPALQERMHILEIFAKGVDKWRGLSWLAEQHDVEPEQIAAIGDEINDVQMLQHAGCGVAMTTGINEAKQVADNIAPGNNDDGVAYAIEKLLADEW